MQQAESLCTALQGPYALGSLGRVPSLSRVRASPAQERLRSESVPEPRLDMPHDTVLTSPKSLLFRSLQASLRPHMRPARLGARLLRPRVGGLLQPSSQGCAGLSSASASAKSFPVIDISPLADPTSSMAARFVAVGTRGVTRAGHRGFDEQRPVLDSFGFAKLVFEHAWNSLPTLPFS